MKNKRSYKKFDSMRRGDHYDPYKIYKRVNFWDDFIKHKYNYNFYWNLQKHYKIVWLSMGIKNSHKKHNLFYDIRQII